MLRRRELRLRPFSRRDFARSSCAGGSGARPAAAVTRRLALAAFGAVCALAACAPAATTAGFSPAGTTPAATPSPTATATFPAAWPAPDRQLTPGVIATTDVNRLCPHVDPALEAARPTTAEKARVYAAYGLTYPQPAGKYELDHLLPLELGGAPDDPANEWPELNDAPDPAAITKNHLSPAFVHNSKDLSEDVLHADVCAGTVSLGAAQQAMLSDWRQAYVTYVGQPLP